MSFDLIFLIITPEYPISLKVALIFIFSLFSFFGYSQKTMIDSLQEMIKETIIVGATDKENILKEIELRTELSRILTDSLASIPRIDSTQAGDSLNILNDIDSMIAQTHLLTVTNGSDPEAKTDLIHLMNLKTQLETNGADHSTDDRIQQWTALLKDQEFELEDLNDRIKTAKPAKKAETNKSNESKSNDDVFNTSSIVAQIISSSVETGQEFKAKAEIDNKLFEDRKAFMLWPLQNSAISKRYSSTTGQMEFSSDNTTVQSISQGTVIYSKRLAAGAYTMVIKHDNNYYSVYSNLSSSSLSYGQYVGYGQNIGTAKTNDNGKAQLSFEIWKNTKRINPMHWLKRG